VSARVLGARQEFTAFVVARVPEMLARCSEVYAELVPEDVIDGALAYHESGTARAMDALVPTLVERCGEVCRRYFEEMIGTEFERLVGEPDEPGRPS
jgi:hypothetical protein